MSKQAILMTALLALWALPQAANAEVYKWVDENGKVQFGDQPPTGSKTVKIKAPPAPPPSAAPAPVAAAAKKPAPSAKEQAADKAKADNDKANKEIAAKNCELAKKNLAGINEADYVNVKDKHGQESAISGQAKAAEADRWRKERDKWCALAKD